MRFWGSAGAVAVLVAALTAGGVPLLMRLETRAGIWIQTAPEIWLLAVFTEGVLVVLFALAGLGGWWVGAPGVRKALKRGEDAEEEEEGPADPEPRSARSVLWLGAVGIFLLTLYGAGSLVVSGME